MFLHRIRHISRRLCPGHHGGAWRLDGSFFETRLFGRVGIVDAFAPTSEHGTPPSVLQCELQPLGYREISLDPLEGSNAYWPSSRHPPFASGMRPEAILPVQYA